MKTEFDSDIVIIGAGMTGLCLGHHLLTQNQSVLLLEKSRGVGGRLATRRFDRNMFDTGAQFMRARSEEFRAFLKPHVQNNTLKLWKEDEQGNPMYWGGHKMTDLPKALAAKQKINLETQVEKLEFHQQHWNILAKDNFSTTCKQLVITSPLPQSLQLLSNSGLEIDSNDLNKMMNIEYRKTLGLLATCTSSPPNVWMDYPDHPDLERCVDQSQKGVSQQQGCLMFHFTHEFSTKWIEAPENEIEQEMLRIIKDLDFQIKTSQLKKWRYADPLTTYGAMAYSPKTYPTLHLGGDAFGGGSVEGAWRSAMKLLSLLNL